MSIETIWATVMPQSMAMVIHQSMRPFFPVFATRLIMRITTAGSREEGHPVDGRSQIGYRKGTHQTHHGCLAQIGDKGGFVLCLAAGLGSSLIHDHQFNGSGDEIGNGRKGHTESAQHQD